MDGRFAERGNVMFDKVEHTARWTGTVKAPGLPDRVRLPPIKVFASYPGVVDPIPAREAVRTEEHDLFDGSELDVAHLADALWGGTWEVMFIRSERNQKIAVLAEVSQGMRKSIRDRRALAQMGGEVRIHSETPFMGGPVRYYCHRSGDDMPTAMALPTWAVPNAPFCSDSYHRIEYDLLEINPVMAMIRERDAKRVAQLGCAPRGYYIPTKALLSWAKPA